MNMKSCSAKLQYWPTMQIFTIELITQADSGSRQGGSHRISWIPRESYMIFLSIQKV